MSETNCFFSIIMPVYNTERYLMDAAESVLAQTFGCFELLLIDDASPDGSGALCDALQARDARVRAVHLTKNRGLSGARNAGLDLAAGRYVYFMDSDDTIDETLLESVFRSLRENPAQAVLFGMYEEYFDASGAKKGVHEVKWRRAALRGRALRREIIKLESASLYGYAWNKVYDLERVRALGLRFETVPLIEDIRFNVAFFMDAHSLNCLDAALYRYAKRGTGSLTAKFAPDYYALHMERVRLLREQYLYWNMYTDEVKAVLGAVYARFLLSALQRNCDKRANMTHDARKNFVKELRESELYRELMPYAKPKSAGARAVAVLLKAKAETTPLLLARAVHAVERGLPLLFARVKQNR